MLDHDTWLANSVEEYFSGVDYDEYWKTYERQFWDDWKRDYNFDTLSDFLKNTLYGYDSISTIWDKKTDKEYDVSVEELAEKYPDVANAFYNSVKPKNIDELYKFLEIEKSTDKYAENHKPCYEPDYEEEY